MRQINVNGTQVAFSANALIFRGPIQRIQAQSHFATETRNNPELGISAENSVRPFRTTFLGLMESNPQLEGALFGFFERQVCQDRIEIDRNSPSTKCVVAVKIDMLPGRRKDLLQEGQSFGIFARLIFIQEARKDGGVVMGGLPVAMERKLTLSDQQLFISVVGVAERP